ncbi:hypothetical protein C6369_000535 [Rhodococcus rhodochrous]|nr:hypothetical protein C6369_000535 [Rhodococcus rhodochrous]
MLGYCFSTPTEQRSDIRYPGRSAHRSPSRSPIPASEDGLDDPMIEHAGSITDARCRTDSGRGPAAAGEPVR